MTTPRTCRDCGARFDGETWQRYCWGCWRDRKDRDLADDAYHRGWMDGLAAGRRAGRALDPEVISLAIELCHPDRHPPERFEKANRVTAQLLELRKGVAA